MTLHATESEIPNFAFNSRPVLAVQLSLLFFYAALLLLVPLVRALTDGALPIELSLKGARWSEGIDGLSDEVSDRLTKAEEQSLDADRQIEREIEELRSLVEGRDSS